MEQISVYFKVLFFVVFGSLFSFTVSWALLFSAKLAWELAFASSSPFSVNGVEILLGAIFFLLLVKLSDPIHLTND